MYYNEMFALDASLILWEILKIFGIGMLVVFILGLIAEFLH